jgi:hypothetical protein
MLKKMIQFFSFSLIIFLIGITFSYGQVSYRDYSGFNPEVPRITAFEAMSLYKQGKLILVDAASYEDHFRNHHIVGAISVEHIHKMKITLPNNFIIAFYCG